MVGNSFPTCVGLWVPSIELQKTKWMLGLGLTHRARAQALHVGAMNLRPSMHELPQPFWCIRVIPRLLLPELEVAPDHHHMQPNKQEGKKKEGVCSFLPLI